MNSKIMELRLKQWMPIFEEQAKSGLNKQEWCTIDPSVGKKRKTPPKEAPKKKRRN